MLVLLRLVELARHLVRNVAREAQRRLTTRSIVRASPATPSSVPRCVVRTRTGPVVPVDGNLDHRSLDALELTTRERLSISDRWLRRAELTVFGAGLFRVGRDGFGTGRF